MPGSFVPWTIMIVAPSAFFLVAMVMWWAKTVQAKREAAKKEAKK
jgi:Na+-transporting NADH:ubiquinone oxidoreductase subunit D